MKILSWNIRGLGNEVKWSVVRRMLRSHEVEMAFLQETKLDSFNLWDAKMKSNSLTGKWQTIDIEAEMKNVFAPNGVAEQGILWEELKARKIQSSGNWILEMT
ncbi:hypothetical protein GQ457_08G036930 [Hibiscus cannabinus]